MKLIGAEEMREKDLKGLGFEFYEELLGRFLDLLKEHLGDRLI